VSIPLALVLLTLSGGADERTPWGGFRGNNGCGVVETHDLPARLDPEANLMWRVEVPPGYSSPTVTGSRLFLTGSDNKGKLFTVCLDAQSGEERWRVEVPYDGSRPGANSPAAPSPVTDGERVYALFHHIGLITYDLDGQELWRHEIGPFKVPHGMSGSPVVHDGKVVLQIDQDGDSYLVAYEGASGKELWRAARKGMNHGYATPAVYAPQDGPAQVVASGTMQIAGYSLETGEKLWWVDGSAWQAKSLPVFAGKRCFVNAFMPSMSDMSFPAFTGTFEEALAKRDADGDGKIARSEWKEDEMMQQIWFILDLNDDDLLDEEDWNYGLAANRATGGLFAIDLDGRGDLTEKVSWKLEDKRTLSDVTSPVLLDGVLYVIAEGSLLASIDAATGEVLKHERIGQSDQYYASPVAGDGKLYLAGLSGLLTVVEAGRDWKVLASHSLEDEGQLWSTPAIAGHSIYVRATDALFCFEQAD
jgi:outer membrane protein assembly factor BamB